MPIPTGTRLGPYEILAQIGAGGMGEVYRARDARLERDVAIKVLPETLARDQQAVVRFVREMKALAALSHPGLLAIFDTGTEKEVTYAVTELLEGESLRAVLDRGPLPWRRVVELGAALAEGMAAAHSKGVVHRDLKPGNIFLTTGGRLKVLDFGLARFEAAPDDSRTQARTQTEGGMLMGTPGYMSPEQIRGTNTGPASDIFSFGCVLHEMLTGARPFRAATAAEVMTAILRDPPSEARTVVGAAADWPAELDELIGQCLEKDPARRAPSAGELAVRLRALLNNRGGSSAVTFMPTAAPRGSGGAGIDSIAVLPFANSSNDPDAEYLSDGIAESILNSMAGIAQLSVTPRSAVFRYKGRAGDDPQAIGRELNVRAVVTGRVMQRGENLVVGAELIDVQRGSQLWGERYNRKMADIFALEEEIARKISESLRVKLASGGREGRRSTSNAEAYQAYLRGRHHWIRRTPDHLRKALEHFQRALEHDPAYAAAYAGLADCYAILGTFSVLPAREAFARAKSAAVSAITFDESLAEGHTSLGYIKAYFDFDWAGAEREFRRALELNPGYWVTRLWFGLVLNTLSRHSEAEEQVRKAIELEPLSPAPVFGAGIVLAHLRRYDELTALCRESLEQEEHYAVMYWLGVANLLSGRGGEAVPVLERTVELARGAAVARGALGHAYAVTGDRFRAEGILAELLACVAGGETVDAMQIALIQCGLGNRDAALEWLEKACAARGGMLPILIAGDERLDPVRTSPRFQEILGKMGLGRS